MTDRATDIINKITEGQEAATLLGEGYFKRMLAKIEAEALEAAIASANKPEQTEHMRIHLLKAQVARDVVSDLQALVRAGKHAEQRAGQA
jgi:hypothetical protein